MEEETGEVLYDLASRRRMEPASTTKIATAMVVLVETKGRLDEKVLVSSRAAAAEGSSAQLHAGQRVSVKDLLYALMLLSGNDAATALAEHVAGTEVRFAALMNEMAKELGARSTHFANASGLPDRNHYTTAYDLALLTRYAYRSPAFRQIVSTKSIRLSWLPEPAVNHNKMLWRYPGADGVKPGFTTSAQQCWVVSAERQGRRLIAVVLGDDRTTVFDDLTRLLDYGFAVLGVK